jgi:hypothetical protein
MGLDSWLGSSFPLGSWLSSVDQSFDAVRLIADKPTSIAIRRKGVALDAQTVRLEATGDPSERRGENATTGTQTVLVLGYKGVPGQPDLDIRRGDRFYVASDDMTYTVTQILPDMRDCVQAIAQATQGA